MLEIVLLAALGGLRLCCLEPVGATSASMEPAVPRHAILIVDRTAFRDGRRPVRGDLVVFDSPEREGERLVKRVVGLPGGTVAIRERVLHLDGERAGSVASCDTQACSATETLGEQRYRVTYALEPYLPGEAIGWQARATSCSATTGAIRGTAASSDRSPRLRCAVASSPASMPPHSRLRCA